VRGWLPWHLFDFVDAPARALFHDRWANAPTGHRISSLHFGYSAFTPRKGTVEQCLDPRWAGNATREGRGCILSETDPIDDDRPYAGLLYVRARRSSVGYRTAWTTDLTIGVLGTGLGKAVQQFIHRNVSKDVDPGGWHHQISNGGELTGRYRAAFRWEALEGPSLGRWPRAFDLTVGGEGGIGYYTNVGANARVRLGLIASSALTQERHGSEPFLVREKLGLASADGGSRDVEAYLFATGGWTLWGRNALLQGQFSESDVTLGFDEGPAAMERRVWDWQIGATLRVRRFTATFTRTEHSRLFGPPNGRPHSWGTVLLTVRPKRLGDRPHGPPVR
jgi:hypothetical protein